MTPQEKLLPDMARLATAIGGDGPILFGAAEVVAEVSVRFLRAVAELPNGRAERHMKAIVCSVRDFMELEAARQRDPEGSPAQPDGGPRLTYAMFAAKARVKALRAICDWQERYTP